MKTDSTPAVPTDVMGLARDAKDQFERGNYRDAEKIYDKALAKAPNNLYLLSNKAVVLFHGPSSNAAPAEARRGQRPAPDLGPAPEILAPVPNTLPGLLGKPLKWKSTDILVAPQNDATHFLYSVKDPAIFARVVEAIGDARTPVFYLEIPPFLFGTVIAGLAGAGVTRDARYVVEKPFGHDLASARALNRELHA